MIEAHPSELTILVHYEVSQPCSHVKYMNSSSVHLQTYPAPSLQTLQLTTQVQEVNMLPDGTQEVMSREASEKK